MTVGAARGLWRSGTVASAALALALAPGLARAACTIALGGTAPAQWQGASGAGYEVFDPTTRVQAVSIQVIKTSGGACEYAIGFSTGSAGAYDPRQLSQGGNVLAYNLYDTAAQSNVLKSPPDVPLLSGSFGAGGGVFTNTHTYHWAIPAGQVVVGGSGQYSDAPTLRLYEVRGSGNLVLNDTKTKTHRALVPKLVELSLLDPGGAFSASDTAQLFAFGTLASGQQRSADLRVRGNTAFTVTLQSQYANAMRHVSLPSQVPYVLSVNGTPVSLASGNPVVIGSFAGNVTPLSGILYPITATIGSLVGAIPGLHQDHVTASVIAQ